MPGLSGGPHPSDAGYVFEAQKRWSFLTNLGAPGRQEREAARHGLTLALQEIEMPMMTSNVSGSEQSGHSRMENEGGPSPAHRSSDVSLEQELAALKIACVQTRTFEWGGYRYTNAHDAIAAAKRGVSS